MALASLLSAIAASVAPRLAGLLLRLVGAEVVTLGRWCREFVLAKLRGALDAIGLAETSWPPREHVLAARLLSDQSGSPARWRGGRAAGIHVGELRWGGQFR